VLLIKLADRLHNMRTLEFVPPASRRRIAEETLDIYAPLAGRMGMQEMPRELEDLSFRTLDPEAYAVVKQRARRARRAQRNLISEMKSTAVEEFAEKRRGRATASASSRCFTNRIGFRIEGAERQVLESCGISAAMRRPAAHRCRASPRRCGGARPAARIPACACCAGGREL